MNRVATQTTNLAKAQGIFSILAMHMGTTYTTGTGMINVIGGYSGFFIDQPGAGHSWNYKELSNGTPFTTYQKELKDDCPIHLSVHTNNKWNDYGEGHDMINMGYAKSTTGTQYLYVLTGWDKAGHFVKFNYYPYFYGYKIWVANK